MKNSDVEELLLTVVKLDDSRLSSLQCDEVSEFLKYNEWGLAYDVLAYAINHGSYTPSKEASDLIRQAAKAMGVEYPKMCN